MKKLIIALGIIAPSLLFGQIDRSIVPSPGKAPEINIKDSETFKTSNGITVILSENHKLPRVTFDLVVGPGPLLEGQKAGLSEVAGSLIMSGTSTYSKDELDSKIDYIGARLSADKNSLTLSCLTKHMTTGLKLMSDVLKNANFPESEYTRIVKQYESSLLSAKSDPSQMGQNAIAKANFKNHPYGEVMDESTLKNITLEDVKNFYKSTFTPYNSYLVVVGDITRGEAEKMIESYFADWNGPKFTTPEYNMPTKNAGNRVIFVNKPGAVQSYVQITYPMNIAPGDADQLPLTVLNAVLGGGAFGNRLMQNLREDKAYTYGCRSALSIEKEGSLFLAGGNFRNEVTDSAIVEILKEIEGLTDGYATDTELSSTKSSMAGSFARSLESPNTIARFALNIIRNDLPKDYYQTYLKKLDAVTKDDMLTMAQKYFTPRNCNIIVVGNEAILDKLLPFDADGKIEKLDAFGNEVKDLLPADISADELLAKYVSAVTKTSSTKELAKKMKKVKTVKQTMSITIAQAPFPLESTTLWSAPNGEGSKLGGGGMTFQSTYFNGTTGFESNMQTGKKELTPEQITARNKSIGLYPEANYKTSGMTYELIGIENVAGTPMYVLKLNDGETETYDYFDTKSFLKMKSNKIGKDDEGNPQESTTVYSNYKEVGGLLFPHTLTISFADQSLNGEIKEVLINEGSLEDFK